MKKVLKAEMWDKMQYLFRNFYDRTMHSVYYYDGNLDEQALGEVYMAMLKKIPVLHSTFHNNPIRPYWTVNEDYKLSEFFELVETAEPEKYLDDFVGTEVIAQGRLQIRVRLIRNGGKDTLAIVINHMCFDGGDLRYFNTKVAQIYTRYKTEGVLEADIKTGTRSADQVYDAMSEEDKKHALSLYKNISSVESKVVFPFAKADGSDKSRIVRYKLGADVFTAIKSKGKAHNATINDIILAAYYRSLYKVCKTEEDKLLTVPCMCDLRRYCENGTTKGLTNMTGFMPCTLTGGAGETMEETVEKVKTALQPSKDDKFVGLYSLPLLKLAYTVFPHCISEFAIKIGYTNPYIGMSNIGILKATDFTMDGIKLYDAWHSGATKFKPYMQLALTTFENVVTFSIAIRGNDEDVKIFTEFLKDICQNLVDYAESK